MWRFLLLAWWQVIPSKQRPRKISMQGEDGRDYVFLLKGHEDLRQDERVMQLFGQVGLLEHSACPTGRLFFFAFTTYTNWASYCSRFLFVRVTTYMYTIYS